MRLLAGLWVVAVVTVSQISFLAAWKHYSIAQCAPVTRIRSLIGHSRLGSTGNIQVLAPLSMHGRVGRKVPSRGVQRSPEVSRMHEPSKVGLQVAVGQPLRSAECSAWSYVRWSCSRSVRVKIQADKETWFLVAMSGSSRGAPLRALVTWSGFLRVARCNWFARCPPRGATS
jgi:hypothetical protein